jgi:surface polysaccharide O-acyltransferase-like enzyme
MRRRVWMSKTRLGALDILRALAALAVVVIHITAGPMVWLSRESPSFMVASLLNEWARFSIPAFVLLTGLVLAYGYGPEREFRPGVYLRKRLKSIAVPYLFWSALYMLFRGFVEHNWTGLLSRFGTALLEGSAMYQLYFIVLIFQYYLLFPLIRPLLQKSWFNWVVLGAVLFQLFLMADTYFGWVHPSGSFMTWAYYYRDRLFPWWIGYFALGAWIGVVPARLERLKAWLWPLAGAATALLAWMMVEYLTLVKNPAISIGFAASGFRPSAYLYAIIGTGAILGWGARLVEGEGRLRRFMDSLGRHSFGIYLIHPLFLWGIDRFVGRLHLHPMAYLGFVIASVLALSWAATWLVHRLPGGRLVMGN